MRFEIVNHYDADPAAVFTAQTDPAVVTAKYEALGHRQIEVVEHVDDATGVRLHTRRIVPLDVPSFARRVLSPTNTVDQVDSWAPGDAGGRRTGTYSVKSKGVPVDITGVLAIDADPAGGSAMTITTTVECRIPLVGGKIADFLAGSVRTTIAAEQRFTSEHLASTG